MSSFAPYYKEERFQYLFALSRLWKYLLNRYWKILSPLESYIIPDGHSRCINHGRRRTVSCYYKIKKTRLQTSLFFYIPLNNFDKFYDTSITYENPFSRLGGRVCQINESTYLVWYASTYMYLYTLDKMLPSFWCSREEVELWRW